MHGKLGTYIITFSHNTNCIKNHLMQTFFPIFTTKRHYFKCLYSTCTLVKFEIMYAYIKNKYLRYAYLKCDFTRKK